MESNRPPMAQVPTESTPEEAYKAFAAKMRSMRKRVKELEADLSLYLGTPMRDPATPALAKHRQKRKATTRASRKQRAQQRGKAHRRRS